MTSDRSSETRSVPTGDTEQGGRELDARLSPARISLLASVSWNVAGQVAPLAAAIATLPIIVHTLAAERFGLLSLAWGLIGYFNIFDLGLGRTLTQFAARIEHSHESNLPDVAWFALAVLLILGTVGAVIIATASPWIVTGVMNLSEPLEREATASFRLIAFALPFVLASAGLRGLLEGRQLFRFTNAVRLPLGVVTFVGPVAVLPFTRRVDLICLVLVAARVAAFIAFAIQVRRVFPMSPRVPSLGGRDLSALMRFSGWVAVSNVVNPLMTYLDRFVIAGAISVAAVAFYTTPFDTVTRLLVVPSAISGVMFPWFARAAVSSGSDLDALFARSWKVLALTLFPLVAFVVAFAEPLLSTWMGDGFPERSTAVLQWLSAGVLANGIAQTAFVFVQAVGLPKVTAVLNLLELPLYALMLATLVVKAGIAGAAIAWTIRVSVDAVALFIVARVILHQRIRLNRQLVPVAAMPVLLVLAAQPAPLWVHGVVWLLATVAAVGLAATTWVTPDERSAGLNRIVAFVCAGHPGN